MKYILIAVMIGALLWALNIGINRQEQKECARWQAYDASQLAGWQIEQCQAHGIKLK